MKDHSPNWICAVVRLRHGLCIILLAAAALSGQSNTAIVFASVHVNWKNPYAQSSGVWLKGNLHAHTKASDGKHTTEQMNEAYAAAGFDFLGITDHHIAGAVSDAAPLIMLAGLEYNIPKHMNILTMTKELVFFAKVPAQDIIDSNVMHGGIIFLNHPDWNAKPAANKEHYTVEDLFALSNYTGIELINTGVGDSGFTDTSWLKWNRLLSSGRRVLAFANHDAHSTNGIRTAATVVRASDRSAKSVFEALRSGNSYCYNGVTITDIGRRGNTVFVVTENAALIRFIGFGGGAVKRVKTNAAEITMTASERYRYIRVECLGVGDEISYSQPFFRD